MKIHSALSFASLFFFIWRMWLSFSFHLSILPRLPDIYQVARPISKMLSRWFWDIHMDHSIFPCVWEADLWQPCRILMYNFRGGIKDSSLSQQTESGHNMIAAFHPGIPVWDSKARLPSTFNLHFEAYFSPKTKFNFFPSFNIVTFVCRYELIFSLLSSSCLKWQSNIFFSPLNVILTRFHLLQDSFKRTLSCNLKWGLVCWMLATDRYESVGWSSRLFTLLPGTAMKCFLMPLDSFPTYLSPHQSIQMADVRS